MRLLPCVLLIGFSASPLHAQFDTTDYDRRTLAGLNGVYVYVAVEHIDSSVASTGFTKLDVQTDVEVRLREAGIPVLNLTQLKAQPGTPALYVDVLLFTRDVDPDFYAFSVTVQLFQAVRLTRNSTEVEAATWTATPYLGTVGRERLRDVRNDVLDAINQFVNDYLAVNPKR